MKGALALGRGVRAGRASGQQIPALAGVLQNQPHIVGEHVAVPDERRGRLLNRLQVLLARLVALSGPGPASSSEVDRDAQFGRARGQHRRGVQPSRPVPRGVRQDEIRVEQIVYVELRLHPGGLQPEDPA